MLLGAAEGEVLGAMRRWTAQVIIVVGIAAVAALPLALGSHNCTLVARGERALVRLTMKLRGACNGARGGDDAVQLSMCQCDWGCG